MAAAESIMDISKVNEGKVYKLSDYQSILADSEISYSDTDVVSGIYDPKFQKSGVSSLGYRDLPVWIRFIVQNDSQDPQDWNLSFQYPLLTHVTIYERGNPLPLQITGASVLVKERSIQDRLLGFDLVSQPKSLKTYYIKISTVSTNRIDADIQSKVSFQQSSVLETFLYSIGLGGFLIMLFYNFMLTITLRRAEYFFYTLFIASSIMRESYINGFSQYFFWPGDTSFNVTVGLQSIFFSTIFANIFTFLFLELRHRHPRIYFAYVLYAVFLICLQILSFFTPYDATIKLMFVSTISNLSLSIVVGLYSYLKGYKPALYFCGAWIFPGVGFYTTILVTYGVSLGTWSQYAATAGQFLELIFLSFAFGDKVKDIHRQKELADQKLNEQLQNFNKELNKRVEEQTKDIEHHKKVAIEAHRSARIVLDHIEEGIVLINMDGSLTGEYSKAVVSIIGPVEATKKIWDFVSRVSYDASSWLEMTWLQLEMRILPVDLILNQLPKIIKVNNGEKYLSFSFSYIKETDNVLMVVVDVTDKVQAIKKHDKQAELIQLVDRIVKYGHIFHESIEELQEMIHQISLHNVDIRQQKLILHTLKGSSAALGMSTLPRLVHELESKIKDSDGYLSNEDLSILLRTWDELMDQLKPFLSSYTDLRIEVDLADYQLVVDSVREDVSPEHTLKLLESWRWEPTRSRLFQAAEHAKILAKNLSKPEPHIEIRDHGLRLDGEKWRFFWASFSHAVCNAVDHGIEPYEERIKHDKPSHGRIELITRQDNGYIAITIADDGQGVSWDKIRNLAKAKNIPHKTQKQLINALFHEGLSSKEQASLYSGRGIGMAALQKACTELGGKIHVVSEPGLGTKIEFLFPFDENNIFAA